MSPSLWVLNCLVLNLYPNPNPRLNNPLPSGGGGGVTLITRKDLKRLLTVGYPYKTSMGIFPLVVQETMIAYGVFMLVVCYVVSHLTKGRWAFPLPFEMAVDPFDRDESWYCIAYVE